MLLVVPEYGQIWTGPGVSRSTQLECSAAIQPNQGSIVRVEEIVESARAAPKCRDTPGSIIEVSSERAP